MKTLRNLREATDEFKLAPRVVELTEEADETDVVGHTLVALNHMASITDDLYSAIGDGSITITEDEVDSILSSYELLSEIHDKYDEAFPMPSQDYDIDALDVEVAEEVQLQLEELALAEAAAWQATVKTLTGLGFKEMKPEGKQPYMVPQKKISHIWGKAPLYFVILMDEDAGNKPYIIVDSEDASRTAYTDLNRALADLKKMVGDLKEETIDEAGPIKRVTFVPNGPMEKDLFALGFAKTKPSDSTYNSTNKIASLYGIPMRAGKFADVYFVVYDSTDKPYGIVDAKGATRYQTMGQAITAVKSMAKGMKEDTLEEAKYSFQNKMSGKVRTINANSDADAIAKMNKIHPVGDDALKYAKVSSVEQWFKQNYKIFKEGVELEEEAEITETPGGPSVVQKLKASRDHFQAKLDTGKFPNSAQDIKKIIAKLDAQIAAHSLKKEETELEEGNLIDMDGKTCTKCGKGKYKETSQHDDMDGVLHCDKCGDKVKRWQKEIPLSKTKGGKRILSALKKEDVDQIDEVKVTITKWNLNKGVEGQYRMEVIGQDGSAAAKILDKVMPSAKFALFDDQFGFKTTAERDAASAALVKFYSSIKEWNTTEIPLGSISEEFDETKFRRLAMTGLVPDTDVALIIRAMKNLDAGKTLDMKQKNLIANTFQSLIGLVTGDVSVFTKIQGAIKKDVTNAK